MTLLSTLNMCKSWRLPKHTHGASRKCFRPCPFLSGEPHSDLPTTCMFQHPHPRCFLVSSSSHNQNPGNWRVERGNMGAAALSILYANPPKRVFIHNFCVAAPVSIGCFACANKGEVYWKGAPPGSPTTSLAPLRILPVAFDRDSIETSESNDRVDTPHKN